MKRHEDTDTKETTLEDKKKLIDEAHQDAVILMKFLIQSDIGPSRGVNGISHLLGIMIASGDIDDEDVRNIYHLSTFTGNLYKQMLEDEGKNASA